LSEELIYLDSNATTPVDPEVLEAMLPYFQNTFANAASFSHFAGRKASDAVEQARENVAKLIGAEAKDIIFTAGATESINLALKGYAEFNFKGEGTIVTSPVEHKAVLEVADYLSENHQVEYVKVNSLGEVNLDSLGEILSKQKCLVSLQHANNEVGSVNKLYEIGALCRKYDSTFHVDAAQTAGKLQIDVEEMNIDLLSLSAHKMYGPKGVGALYVRRRNPRIRLSRQMHGGKQEREFRPGTLNVPGIVGLGKAAELASKRLAADKEKITKLTESFKQTLLNNLPDIMFNGPAGKGLPGNLNFTIPGLDARELLCELPELAMSTGSACTSELSEPSHVLRALGIVGDKALATLRVGINRFNTVKEIDRAVELLVQKVIDIRQKTARVEQVS
jgi:cysteine desulfurase